MHKQFNEKILIGYSVCRTTLKMTSYDKGRQIYLTDITDGTVINFDGLTRKVYKNLPFSTPCSNDALLLTDNYNYFIEFKNQPLVNIENSLLVNKNISSMITLLSENLTNISTLKKHYIYLVVFNDSPKDSKSELNSLLAKEDPPPEELNYLETHYFAKIKAFTDPEKFKKYFYDEIMSEHS